MFSTGHIMLNIAKIGRDRGTEVWTVSKKTRASINRNCADDWHTYIGTRVEHTLHRYFSWITDLQDFGSVVATYELIRKIKKINPDIIHLHDLVGWYVNIGILFRYLKKIDKPIVWTFHDCWAFTGRCVHFDYVGCTNWKNGCGNCPQKEFMPRSWFFDLSAFNWRRRKRLFTAIKNMTIVTPSMWLKELTHMSFLSDYRTIVINNGINLDIFKPTTGELYYKLKSRKKRITAKRKPLMLTKSLFVGFVRQPSAYLRRYLFQRQAVCLCRLRRLQSMWCRRCRKEDEPWCR